MLEDCDDNPRYVLYSESFRGKHAFRGVAHRAMIMTRIAQDDIFRKIVLDVRMRNGTPRVFVDRPAVARHMRHHECSSACLTNPCQKASRP